MYETADEMLRLQELLDRSLRSSTDHLKGIINGERVLSAVDVVALLTGMKVISVATVTAAGHPRISAVDGHFLHATWSFSTDGSSAKARHLRARPDVSIAHVDNEELAIFSHGRVVESRPSDPDWDERLDHWTAHYGSSPLTWGDDIRLYRCTPHWMVGYASNRHELLRSRGVAPQP
jgi:general stress protein 26